MAAAVDLVTTDPCDRRTEPALTLEGPVPRPLGMTDQLALWGNLGVSLLGPVRALRRYALVAVVIATVYLVVQLARHPVASLTDGSWSGFWLATDVVIAVAVSWVPLAADYSRHSRSGRAAFLGSFLGYTVSQAAYYALGLLAFATVVSSQGDTQTNLFGAFLAVPLGWMPFGILVLRELDESFTNVYSTVVSVQNVRPLSDRRVLAVIIGTLATILALVLHIADHQSFLYLLGSVFVPMFAVFAVDYFALHGRHGWDCSMAAPSRWVMLVPWLLGFASYQLVNPGSVSWWASVWTGVRRAIGFTPPTWMSASLSSCVVAAAATFAVGLLWRGEPLVETRVGGGMA